MSRKWAAVSGGLVVLAIWGVVLVWNRSATAPDVGALPEAQRRALYVRTLEDLELCTESGATLADHCRHQAALVVLFPECDARCRGLAAPWHAVPSR